MSNKKWAFTLVYNKKSRYFLNVGKIGFLYGEICLAYVLRFLLVGPLDGNQIILKKYKPYNECVVTGEVTSQNREYANGIVLSPRGAEILKHEIEFRYGIKA
ncbi:MULTISPECIES: hypothetical protein [Priestia]|uniref:AbrB C-terminal domain-containing protein n=1 Tax=Priestia veravalensis TaxID=1414648 RepID=A0A0V8JHA7_9BACI|nr:hypothetical protein AS180_18740 [Priestia veravalensis]SCC52819.1 hypothetical protein GA0061087_107513 [Priestia flexa]SIR48861.1 hypothetical protein SAMN05880580_12526 [Priestia flexa]